MKKLLVALAMVGMGLMAQAEWSYNPNPGNYTYQVTVEDVPEAYRSLTGNAGIYLIDKKTSTILSYALVKEFLNGGTSISGQMLIDGDHNRSASGEVPLKGYKIDASCTTKASTLTMISLTGTGTETKNVEFFIYATPLNTVGTDAIDAATDYNKSRVADVGQSTASNLRAIVYDPGDGTDAHPEYYQEIDDLYVNTGSTAPNFQRSVKFEAQEPQPGPIPEPTSGLLLLIGVAGLALRRRAA